jgi:CubicO group peptidase (beta-lactamase class C family)
MIKKSLFLLALACTAPLLAVASPINGVFSADGPSTDYFETNTPDADADYSARAAALFAADQGDTRAVMIIQAGKPVFTRYAPGYSDQTRFISWSMAKSVTAVLIGELVADGKLKLDAPVPFAEWHTKPDDPRAAITLRNMLNMSSGLDHTEGLDPADGAAGVLKSDTSATLFVNGTGNMVARNIAKGMEAKPGTKYEYSSMTSLLLSELITRQLTGSTDPKARAAAYNAFAAERLFKPAGIAHAFLEYDGAGTQIGGSIIHMTLGDWGRFGQLLMAGKGLDGTQVIAPDWLTFMRTPSSTDTGYGGHIWLNRPRSGDNAKYPALFPGKGPDTLFSAVGHLGQYVIVSPDQDMVLVRLGKTNDGDLGPVRAALGTMVAAMPLKRK